MRSLVHLRGRSGVLFVAPHAVAPLEAAADLVLAGADVQRELALRIADWHDLGTLEALDAATARSGYTGLRPSLPRGLVDLNRSWRGRAEERESLLGKSAVDQWVRQHLRPGAESTIAAWYRAAMAEVRAAAREASGLVELHSYGDLGSTYDRQAGGRPVCRAEVAVVHGAPWVTAYPVGLSRLLPANLRGTPWRIEARVGAALVRRGLTPAPGPYPAQLPWTLSARFLAERWFRWLGRTARLPVETAERLADLAWTDELAEVEQDDTRALARALDAWTHEGSRLAETFSAEEGSFTLGIELRNDRLADAAAFGEAVAEVLT
jgi:hypothetical protein